MREAARGDAGQGKARRAWGDMALRGHSCYIRGRRGRSEVNKIRETYVAYTATDGGGGSVALALTPSKSCVFTFFFPLGAPLCG